MPEFTKRAGREAIDTALSFAREIPRSEVYTQEGVAPQFKGTQLEYYYPFNHTNDFSVISVKPGRDTGIFNGESLMGHPLLVKHDLQVLPGREDSYLVIGSPEKMKEMLAEASQQRSPAS